MNKSTQKSLQLGACCLVLACAACKENAAPPVVKTDGLGEASPQMSESNNQTPSVGERLGQQVASAVADLADRTGIAADAITVTKASVVNWGSGAVGCPREGMNYTQAIVPGVLLLLEANGQIYRYHGRMGQKPFHCPDERAEAPAYGQGEEFM